MGDVTIKRVYEPAEAGDGIRVLVDRLWPRGMTRERAALECWLKDVAPSQELRKWWGHDPARFADFANRYRCELEGNPAVEDLLAIVREHDLTTLVYAARDATINHAAVLRDYLVQALADQAQTPAA